MAKKKEERKFNYKILVGIFLLLFLIIIVFFIGNTVYFSLFNELNVDLSPKDKYILINYNESYDQVFSIHNANFFMCNSICSYNLIDLSNDKLLYSNESFMSHDQTINLTFKLKSDKLGSGQKLFLFEAECNNIKTFLCRTDETKYYDSSLITLNYDLSSTEKELKSKLQELLIGKLNKIKDIDSIILTNKEYFKKVLHLNITEFIELNNRHIILENQFEREKNIYFFITSLWKEQKYGDVSYVLNNLDLNNSETILNDSLNILNELKELSTKYNIMVLNSKELLSDYRFNLLYNFYDPNLDILNIYSEAYLLREELSSNYSISYLDKLSKFRVIKSNFDSYYSKYQNDINKNNFDLKISEIKYKHLFNLSYNLPMYDLNLNYSKNVNESCLEIDNLLLKSEIQNNISYNLINKLINLSYNISYDEIIFKSKQFQYFTFNNLYSDIFSLYSDNLSLKILESILIEKETSDFYYTVSNGSNLTNYTLSDFLIIDIEELNITKNKYCILKNETNILKNVTNIDFIDFKHLKNITSNFSEILPENYDVCCAYGNCDICCTPETCKDNEQMYPVIFLHGHAFARNEPPKSSLQRFTNIQRKISENGIINAGELDLTYTGINYGYLGRSGYPVSVRATYYIIKYYDIGTVTIATQKNEKIENYALRLKEIIDNVKFKTGSSKVNIVTHSMGGLVSREYLRIFGKDSVNKLIMVATPNNGTSESTRDVCSFLGSAPECDDMTSGSIFLKRLNADYNIPKQVKMYTIVGQGCIKDGVDGDGVIDVSSVPLSYAKNYYINGTCTDILNSNLHNDLLDPNKYPQVYDKIVEYLNE